MHDHNDQNRILGYQKETKTETFLESILALISTALVLILLSLIFTVIK